MLDECLGPRRVILKKCQALQTVDANQSEPIVLAKRDELVEQRSGLVYPAFVKEDVGFR